MARKRSRIHTTHIVPGVSPGTLKAPRGSVPSTVSVIAYGKHTFVEQDISDVAALRDFVGKHAVTWVNVNGLGTVETVEAIGEIFGLNRLALEDVLNLPQRPKTDDYGDHQYIVARMPQSREEIHTEQLSIFLGKNYLITFQERPGDCFDSVRQRLRDGRKRIRGSGPDYLAYAVMDSLVDAYFPVLETVGGRLEEVEFEIMEHQEKRHIRVIHDLKRELAILRRIAWPLREMSAALLRRDNPLIEDQTRIFLRDCFDHAQHALDLVDSYRDMASGLVDLYMSMVSQRMNEVMKVLTIIATIFIPLSFIAGVYGMNFDPEASRWNMPELGLPFGYPMVLGVMLLCGGGMLLVFLKRGWFR